MTSNRTSATPGDGRIYRQHDWNDNGRSVVFCRWSSRNSMTWVFASASCSQADRRTISILSIITSFAMAELYLSQREANILRYATLVWGCLQWWDIIDRYVVKKFRGNRAPSAPPAGSNGQAPVHQDGGQPGPINRDETASG